MHTHWLSARVRLPYAAIFGALTAVLEQATSKMSSYASHLFHFVCLFQNTLNRCFDDIERFVGRIQTCALAQRDLELIMQRRAQRRSNKPHPDETVLRARAQLPIEPEFVATFQKFKLCFNLLVSSPCICVFTSVLTTECPAGKTLCSL